MNKRIRHILEFVLTVIFAFMVVQSSNPDANDYVIVTVAVLCIGGIFWLSLPDLRKFK